jgi:hypothetical protein
MQEPSYLARAYEASVGSSRISAGSDGRCAEDRSRAVTELSAPEIVRLRPQSGDRDRERVVRASIRVASQAVGVLLGCVSDAFKEPLDRRAVGA